MPYPNGEELPLLQDQSLCKHSRVYVCQPQEELSSDKLQEDSDQEANDFSGESQSNAKVLQLC